MPIEITKLLVVLIFIIFLLKIRLNLGLTLFFSSLLMGLLFKIDLFQIFIVIRNEITSFGTLELLGIIFLVYLLSIIMEKLKKFEKMVYALQDIIKDYRLVMIFISSFVALLPIQGGAIFSAPMIKSIGEAHQVEAAKNMFINYWFRHIWLFVWPLYPEIILYSSLLGISLKKLIIILLPYAVIAFLAGIIWLFNSLNKENAVPKKSGETLLSAMKDLIQNIWPVLVVILFVLIFNIRLLFSILIIVISLIIFFAEIRDHMVQLFVESFKASYKTLMIILGIFIFKGTLEYSQVIEFLPEFFLSKGIPINGILVAVPFLVAFFTGTTTASIGICVPVFLPFLSDDNGVIISRLIILYLAGYCGLMWTPIHLCLAITKDYFQIRISHFYSILTLNLLILGILSLGYYALFADVIQ